MLERGRIVAAGDGSDLIRREHLRSLGIESSSISDASSVLDQVADVLTRWGATELNELPTKGGLLCEVERICIRYAMAKSHSRAETAKRLGIANRTLTNRLQRLKIKEGGDGQ